MEFFKTKPYQISSLIAYIWCKEILNKIRLRIEKQTFNLKGTLVNITISIGFTIIDSNDTKESAFLRADDALYRSKEGGRNQVSNL